MSGRDASGCKPPRKCFKKLQYKPLRLQQLSLCAQRGDFVRVRAPRLCLPEKQRKFTISVSVFIIIINGNWEGECGGVVAKALLYKPAGRGFDSRWFHWNFSVTKSFRSHYGPDVDSASNRNEYQVYFLGGKGGRCVRLTTLPPSCAVVMKSGNLNFLETSGPLQACNGTALPLPLTINLLKGTTDKSINLDSANCFDFLKTLRVLELSTINVQPVPFWNRRGNVWRGWGLL